MGRTGTIFDAGSMTRYLEEANRDYRGQRTWSNMYGSLDLNRQVASNAIERDYSDAISRAYATVNQNNNVIRSSNLGAGYKNAALADNEQALQAAYDAHMQNYLSGKATINESVYDALGNINTALTEQADYSARYAQSHLDYLQSIWDKTQNGEIDNVFNENNWSKYTRDVYDEQGNLVVDEAGNSVKELLPMHEISQTLFDDNGELTLKGADFFAQMENDMATRGSYSFGDYLQEADSELFNWAASYNPYDYAPDALGNSTNASSFKTAVGMASGEVKYTFMDRAFGLDTGSVENAVKSVEQAMEKLTDTDDIEGAVNNYLSTWSSTVESLGITTEFNKYLESQGMSLDGMKKKLLDALTEYKNVNEEQDLDSRLDKFGITLDDDTKSRLSDALAKFGITSEILDAVSMSTSDELTNKKQQAKEAVTRQANNMITQILSYTQGVRRKAEIDFYGQEQKAGGDVSVTNPRLSAYTDSSGNKNYNYLMPDGSLTKFVTGATKVEGSNVRDKKNDNFSVTYNGKRYKLEVSGDDEVLDGKTQTQFTKLAQQALGRALQEGDLFYNKEQLYVVTNGGTVRKVQPRTSLSNDYEKLIELFKS